MAFKVNISHWEIIVNFMELHPDVARGRINGPNGRETLSKLWKELTLSLNSAGLGERSTDKWQKSWTDFKYSLKKKASAISHDFNGTGGGEAKSETLSDLEVRVLNILGTTFHQGVGKPESGCSFMKFPAEIPQTPPAEKGVDQKITSTLINQDNANKDLVSTPNSSKRCLEDHNYLMQPQKNPYKKMKPKDTTELQSMYSDTVSTLADIKLCLQDMQGSMRAIATSMQGIEAALNKLSK